VELPAVLFGLAFFLAVLAVIVVTFSSRDRVKVLFLVLAGLFLVALVVFGIWQLRGPWPLIG
jgi:uncharacterized membrane protein YqjE